MFPEFRKRGSSVSFTSLLRFQLSAAIERLERLKSGLLSIVSRLFRCARRDEAENGGWRAARFLLEVAFRLQKVTAKLLNDAFYAMFCS